MFETKRFLTDHFRTPSEMIAFVRAFGHTPPENDTAYKWFSRGSVPSTWFPILLALLELDRGGPVSLAKYIK